MNLHTKLNSLCKELLMTPPMPNPQGEFTLLFENQFSVRFFQDKSKHVLVTEDFHLPQTPIDWESVESAMRNSYAWPGLATNLAFDQDKNLHVQTFIDDNAPFDVFFDMTNSHCGFCERLQRDMQKPVAQTMEHYVYITP